MKKGRKNGYMDEQYEEFYGKYDEPNMSSWTRNKGDFPASSKKYVASLMDRDYFEEVLDGMGIEKSDKIKKEQIGEEFVLILNGKVITRERLNHILRDAGLRMAGVDL